MSNRTKSTVWLVLAIAYSVATFFLSSLTSGNLRWMRSYWQYRIDLYIHAIEYGILTWLLLKYFHAAGWFKRFRFTVWLPLVICALIGGANEIWQAFIPGRYATVIDELANIAGSLVVIVGWLLFRRKSKFKP